MKTKTCFVLTGALLIGLLPAAAQVASNVTFTKITTGSIVNDGGVSWACAWGDYDSDGFIDLFVANADNVSGNTTLVKDFLYHNNGNGTFTKVTFGPVVNDSGDSAAGAWADYDNDGNLDLFVATDDIHASGQPGQADFLYRNNGDGTFTKITSGAIATIVRTSLACAWGDYDNDGNVDLFVANRYGQSSLLYHNNGDGTFTQITSGSLVNTPANALGCAWADYDNDGYLDLFVATAIDIGSTINNNWLYHNNRDGSFTQITEGAIVNDGGQSFAGAWADYDNDGDLDLYVANAQDAGGLARNFLYRNNGDGSFTRVTEGVVAEDVGDSGACVWADFDNDGFLDLFNANYIGGGASFFYHNNGDGTFSRIMDGDIVNDVGASASVAAGDYDNDGFQDLFVANEGNSMSENNFLYHNNGNSNRWLTLRLVGSASNRSGIGAKVRIGAHYQGLDRWQMRQISASSGASGQSDMRAAFGLGDATNADLVRIEWPSGTVQELRNVAVNQILTVKEPPMLNTLSKGVGGGGFELLLKGGRGLSYTVDYSTNLIHWNQLTNFATTNILSPLSDTGAASSPQRFYRAREGN